MIAALNVTISILLSCSSYYLPEMCNVHGLDFLSFGSGLLLVLANSGVRFSLLSPEPDYIWTSRLLKKRYWLIV